MVANYKTLDAASKLEVAMKLEKNDELDLMD